MTVMMWLGVGWSMMLMSFIVAIYYNMIIAYILRYLFASFTTTLPWQSCKPEWIPLGCYDRIHGVQNATAANSTIVNGSSVSIRYVRALCFFSSSLLLYAVLQAV